MNFEFSAEQNLLREQARGFLADKCPLSEVRRVFESDEPYALDLWRGMADMGWTATSIPEAYGGIGLGYLELCVIAEELGRSLAPVPFASTMYQATEALLMLGNEAQKQQWLPKIATGDAIGTLAIGEGFGVSKQPTTQFSQGQLTGTKHPVADGADADFAVVLTQDGSAGQSLVLVDLNQSGVARTRLDTIDPSRPHATLEFKDAAAEALGNPGQGAAALAALNDRAAVLFAFEQVGGAQAALNQAKEYAMGRYAFGRPIASFQAIKHKLADMYIAATLAHSNCYYGAWALSSNADELSIAAATARVSATQAFFECSKENIQTHGGMGFTWEADCHLFLRRSRSLALLIGDLGMWKKQIADEFERKVA